MKKRTICGKPVILSPTARERSLATGKPASEFEAIFTAHADCQLAKREEETRKLIARIYK